ncbi:ribosome-binding protein 1-like isoform X2 [Uloborus diversus]|uniref:ribosome-binding protein 1-like isoform X2 n=1 Tax=Uloborus diversus TaxID=327109 RepID=UPI00240A1045|nr:ribosome-binding protein 1-like isoform X2 [Uloborus diversus]
MSLELLSIASSPVAIGSIACTLLVLISYLIYRYSIAEKSFEEAMEEQKRRTIEEELSQKSKKVKKEDKKFKRSWAKKSKDKTEQETQPVVPEIVLSEENKEVIPEIEIIEPKEVKPTKQKNKAKNTTASQSPEISEKSKKTATVTEKSAQEGKKEVKISDAVEKVKPVEKPKPVEKVVTAAKVPEKSKVVVENVVKEVPVVASQVPASAGTSSKKKKKESVEKDAQQMTATKLFTLIKEFALDTDEIQNLIDILLNKQRDSTGWSKGKTDPLATTKRTLEEKSHLLDQEQKTNQAVTSKLKELREEYNLLKTKEKASLEKITRQQQDFQAINLRVKQLQDQLSAEKEKNSLLEKEKVDKKVDDEKVKLKEKLSKLETDYRNAPSKTEYESLKKSKEDLQQVNMLLVEQHTQLVNQHKIEVKNLKAQIEEAKKQAEESNKKNPAALKENQAMVETQKALEEKLKVEQKRVTELDAQVKQLTAKLTDFNKIQAELKELRLENERLAEQLVSTKERVAGDGQEIIHQNGELNGKIQDEEAMKSLAEKDKIIKEKESLLAQVNDDLCKQKARNDALSEEIEAQKQKNNELREKNWKVVDALTNAEKNADQKIKEIQTAAEQKILTIEKQCEEKLQKNSSSSDSSVELSDRLQKVENEAAQRLLDYKTECEKNKQLNSELIMVNSKLKSADSKLTDLEKTVKNLSSELQQSQLHTRQCLLRICPNVSIDSSVPHERWLSEFEKQASSFMQATSERNNQQSNVEQLLEEKEKELLEQQRHYEKVLADTESTLQSLQGSAESQEALWNEKLHQKQLELDKVLSEKNALIAEKEAMQSTFQQINQLEELQEKLKLLQSTLESAENDRSQFEQKCDEVQKNCLNLSDQLENKEKIILELQKEKSRHEHLIQEVEDLKTKLEDEKKTSKNFSSQMIKLNSLVKIGQDALTAEQEMVKKLKSQLEASQVSTANGNSSTIQSSIANSESQPKTKSSDKSKKKSDASVKK